jgi:hypothetical protein
MEAIQFAGWAAATPDQNLAQAGRLMAAVRRMICQALLDEDPTLDDDRLRRRLAPRVLDAEAVALLARRARRRSGSA